MHPNVTGVQVQRRNRETGHDPGQQGLTRTVAPHLSHCGWTGADRDSLLLRDPQHGACLSNVRHAHWSHASEELGCI